MTALGLGFGKGLNPLALGPSISLTFQPRVYGSVSETVALDLAMSPGELVEWEDTFGINNLTEVIYRQLVTVSETTGLAPTISALDGVILTEILGLAPSALVTQIVNVTASDIIEILDQLYPGIPAAISETVGLAVAETIQQATAVIEELGLAETMAPEAIYQLSYSDTVSFADTLVNFFGVDLTEGLGLSGDWVGNLILEQTLSETIALAETHTANLVLRVTASDSLVLEDDQIIEAIYTGTIAEEVEITAAYLSPGGGFTTWAMNTRTAAVTEYSNYEFNSFARMGNKYLGASSTGLYELNGDDDAGDNIIADIKSGFAQFAGTRHTLFKSIYLGVRGEGDFVLRLVDGEGHSYDYAVATRDMRSTKVHMGKGLRARYFSFELISDGQDFDLDTIEFVPLVAQRRV